MILALSCSYRNEAEFKMSVCSPASLRSSDPRRACADSAYLAMDARLMLTTLCLSHW
jgi:hypothetical protein